METITHYAAEIIVIVTGIYELLSRIIPTSKTWSIIGNVINILKRISDYLDNLKKNR